MTRARRRLHPAPPALDAAPEGAQLHPGPPPDPTATTLRMRPIRTSSGQHELYLAFVIHSGDPLELREISDAISATVTRETAGRATVRQETRITSPIRTTIDTTIVDSSGADTVVDGAGAA